MTTIRARSLCHGDVDMSPEAVELVIPDDATPPYFTFRCPTCGTFNVKPTDAQIRGLLIGAGCRVVNVADEVAEAHDDRKLLRWLAGMTP